MKYFIVRGLILPLFISSNFTMFAHKNNQFIGLQDHSSQSKEIICLANIVQNPSKCYLVKFQNKWGIVFHNRMNTFPIVLKEEITIKVIIKLKELDEEIVISNFYSSKDVIQFATCAAMIVIHNEPNPAYPLITFEEANRTVSRWSCLDK